MKDIFNRFPDMYSKSEKLVMGDSLHMILSQGFTEKVYVYTPEYDERVHVDLNDTYRNPDKLKYITGDFANIIEDFDDITTFIFNDIIDISTLIAFNKTKYTNILVANYGYNFTIDDNGNLTLRIDAESMMEEYVFKFSTFTPAKLGSEHFSQVQT
jgi:hypothetical protein